MSGPVSQEIVNRVLLAQRAISKLEDGPAKADFLTAEETAALTWAVLEVTKLYLFSSEPLTPSELAKGQEIVERLRAEKPITGYTCAHCGGGHLGIDCSDRYY